MLFLTFVQRLSPLLLDAWDAMYTKSVVPTCTRGKVRTHWGFVPFDFHSEYKSRGEREYES